MADILVTGAGGQVGRCLVRFGNAARPGSNPENRVIGFTSAEWDITDPAAAGERVRPGTIVVNCAGYTAVDAAESDEAAARMVNETGPAVLARACAAVGARLIHLSTDYVFAGDAVAGDVHAGEAATPYEPDDPTAPRSVYGRSKLAGEQAVLRGGAATTIVRTAGVYTGVGTDFVATMLRLEHERDTVEVVTDQLTSTTYAVDLAAGLLDLAVRGDGGASVLHATNSGAVSWFAFARAIFAGVGADPDRVRPTTAARFARPAPRPAYSVLSGGSWVNAGLRPLRPWQQALGAALTERGGAGAVVVDATPTGGGKASPGTD